MINGENFDSSREAKQYLTDQIVLAAKSAEIPLTETGRKMMYFTESAWAPPDMETVNAAFERDYDTPSYEAKIARLAALAEAHTSASGDLSKWQEATRLLAQEDHYLSVLLNVSTSTKLPEFSWRDRIKLVATALIIIFLVMVGMILFSPKH